MKIMTQNCYGAGLASYRNRFKAIAKKILEEKPDIVCLQEVLFPKQARKFSLPGYYLIWKKGKVFVKGGLVMLVNNKYHLTKADFFRFRDQGKRSSQQIMDRILGKGWLDVEIDGKQHVVTTHLLATYSKGFVRDSNQEKQLRQLLDYMTNKNSLLIVGDLNFDEGSPFYEIISKYANDLTKGMGGSDVRHDRKIDFIFSQNKAESNSKAQFVDYEMDKYPSDHKGIMVYTK